MNIFKTAVEALMGADYPDVLGVYNHVELVVSNLSDEYTTPGEFVEALRAYDFDEDLYNLTKDTPPETWAKEFAKCIDWCNLGVNEHSYCNKTSDLVELSVYTGWLQTADELVEVIATKILETGGNNGV